MTFKETPQGYEFHTSFAMGFFSFNGVEWPDLPFHFPEFSFDRVKQVHGDRLVESMPTVAYEANEVLDEADALFTRVRRRAVTVMTADCLPVLILNPKFVLAIHAGWRGVKNEIVLKSLQNMGFGDGENTFALIGPHIQSQSFEVDKSLAEEFQQQYQVYRIADTDKSVEPPVVLPHARPDKAYVDLKTITMRQLLLGGIARQRIFTLDFDTMTDRRFASHRRDKGHNVGRNFSFASLF